MAKTLNGQDAKALIEQGGVVVVDFFATWCGPCQMFLPVFEEVSGEVEGAELVKIDIDNDAEFAGENSVMGVPTIIAFKDGKEVAKFSGFKPKEELVAFIESVK